MDLDSLHDAARSRDALAWEALGRALSDDLSRFFANCFDRVATEELVQNTVLVIVHKLDEFEPNGPHSFRNWVYAIAARQARAYVHEPRREHVRRSKLVERASPTPVPSPSSALLRRERLDLIARCLPRLPPTHRRTLEHDLADEDIDGVAGREGISTTGVRVRRHRALIKLRRLVEAARATPSFDEA